MGSEFRLYFGAALSIMDMLTDIAAIYRFWMVRKYEYAYANTAFIGVSLIFMLIINYAQNRKRGMKVVAYEALFSICFIKPAIGKFR